MASIDVTRCISRMAFALYNKEGGMIEDCVKKSEGMISSFILDSVRSYVDGFYRNRRMDAWYSYYPKKFRFEITDAKYERILYSTTGTIFYSLRLIVPFDRNSFSKDDRSGIESEINSIISSYKYQEMLVYEVMDKIDKIMY